MDRWRKVKSGILKTPAPRVFQTALSDYYPDYRLFAQAVPGEPRVRANIQDVFNRYGVQIMSPHYIDDGSEPKVVKLENWYPVPVAAEKPADSHRSRSYPRATRPADKEKPGAWSRLFFVTGGRRSGCLVVQLHSLDLLVLPFLDGIGDETRLFMRIGLVVMFGSEGFQRIVDRFGLAVGVVVGHGQLLSGKAKKAPGSTKGLFGSSNERTRLLQAA